jgi:CRISPR/Cas system-associated protein Csm6
MTAVNVSSEEPFYRVAEGLLDKVVYKLLKFEKQGDEAYVNAIPGPKLSGSTLKGYGWRQDFGNR